MHDSVSFRVLDVKARAFAADQGIALAIASTDDVRALDLSAPSISIRFAKPGDGRPYTQARLLREELGYRGRLRAVGAVVVDCIGFMKRCGFDEIVLRDESDEPFALAALDRFAGVDYWRRGRR